MASSRNPELVWLATEDEKVAFFNLMAPSLPPERLPHVTVGKPSPSRLHLFPDGLPIGVESNGRVVFLFLVTSPFDADLRRFLQRHAELLRALPGWTLRLLFLRRAAGMMAAFENAAREELTGRFAPDTIAELKWYCDERRTHVGSACPLPVRRALLAGSSSVHHIALPDRYIAVG